MTAPRPDGLSFEYSVTANASGLSYVLAWRAATHEWLLKAGPIGDFERDQNLAGPGPEASTWRPGIPAKSLAFRLSRVAPITAEARGVSPGTTGFVTQIKPEGVGQRSLAIWDHPSFQYVSLSRFSWQLTGSFC